ncbi:MAG: dual specificity protein phosphatase, partial [Melioribacteraceae bacterium]|nr:dual specificity protein phosphatase [Melioribacteraceae bacterium]
DETYNYILSAFKSNKNILVHCKKGHHRSAAVVGAFLIKHFNLDYKLVTQYINNIRPCALRKDKCMVKSLARYSYYLNNNPYHGPLTCNKVGRAMICDKQKRYRLKK